MKIKDLKIGKWYQPTNYLNYYYSPLKIIDSYINEADYFNGDSKSLKLGQSISNGDFWDDCKEIDITDLPKEYYEALPEKYKIPSEPLIFN